MNNRINTTSAPSLEPFSNVITGGILASVIALTIMGLFLLVIGSFFGVILSALAVIFFVFGFTDIPTSPRTAGVLTFWGSFITLFGKPVVVGGKTILANYFPFYLSAVQIDISNDDTDIKMTVTSQDKVPLDGVVSVTLYPDIDDAIDYIQAGGNIKKILKQLDDIVKKKTREIASGINALEITQMSKSIDDQLHDHISDKLEEKAFGVKVFKVQAIFDQPEDVIKAMKGARIEMYERANENLEYETNIKAARTLQDEYKKDPTMSGKVPTLQDCLREILEQRLIRDGRTTGITNKGGKTIAVAQTGKGTP